MVDLLTDRRILYNVISMFLTVTGDLGIFSSPHLCLLCPYTPLVLDLVLKSVHDLRL